MHDSLVYKGLQLVSSGDQTHLELIVMLTNSIKHIIKLLGVFALKSLPHGRIRCFFALDSLLHAHLHTLLVLTHHWLFAFDCQVKVSLWLQGLLSFNHLSGKILQYRLLIVEVVLLTRHIRIKLELSVFVINFANWFNRLRFTRISGRTLLREEIFLAHLIPVMLPLHLN